MAYLIEGSHRDSKTHKGLLIPVVEGSEGGLDGEIHAMHGHKDLSGCTSPVDPWGSLVWGDYWCSK